VPQKQKDRLDGPQVHDGPLQWTNACRDKSMRIDRWPVMRWTRPKPKRRGGHGCERAAAVERQRCSHLVQATGAADGDRVGGPGGGEAHARADLDDGRSRLGRKPRRCRQQLRLVRLAEQPGTQQGRQYPSTSPMPPSCGTLTKSTCLRRATAGGDSLQAAWGSQQKPSALTIAHTQAEACDAGHKGFQGAGVRC
jgi:hypothetical protein